MIDHHTCVSLIVLPLNLNNTQSRSIKIHSSTNLLPLKIYHQYFGRGLFYLRKWRYLHSHGTIYQYPRGFRLRFRDRRGRRLGQKERWRPSRLCRISIWETRCLSSFLWMLPTAKPGRVKCLDHFRYWRWFSINKIALLFPILTKLYQMMCFHEGLPSPRAHVTC
jgi:hypothetical protein